MSSNTNPLTELTRVCKAIQPDWALMHSTYLSISGALPADGVSKMALDHNFSEFDAALRVVATSGATKRLFVALRAYMGGITLYAATARRVAENRGLTTVAAGFRQIVDDSRTLSQKLEAAMR
jgi:hypothetical protein